MSLLEVKRLEKSFLSPEGENFKVVSVDSYLLNHSEFCGMMGESGSGKQPLHLLLAGILTPDKGSIKLDEQDLTKLNVVKSGLLQNIINRIHFSVIQFTSRFNMFGKPETTHVFFFQI